MSYLRLNGDTAHPHYRYISTYISLVAARKKVVGGVVALPCRRTMGDYRRCLDNCFRSVCEALRLCASMRRYNASTALPSSVTTAAPPFAPPRFVTTSGYLKQRFIVRTSIHARMYDISIAVAAFRRQPVRAMCSNSSALPGPRAILLPNTTRIRGTI